MNQPDYLLKTPGFSHESSDDLWWVWFPMCRHASYVRVLWLRFVPAAAATSRAATTLEPPESELSRAV